MINATTIMASFIPTGDGFAVYDIAVSPSGNLAYVTDYMGGNVTAISLTTNKIVGTIAGQTHKNGSYSFDYGIAVKP